MLVIGMLLTLAATCPAAVITTGSTNSDGMNYYVGYNADGTLAVNGASTFSDYYGYIGYNVGCTGTVTVTGTGSKWTNTVSLYAGYSGVGGLTVGASGQVTTSWCNLGWNAGSYGAVTVTGAGSTLACNYDLYVGSTGNGSLTVTDGGSVTAGTLWGSPNCLFGNGTISARNVVIDADLVFDQSHGLAQSLTFGSGGRLSLNLSGTMPLGVGYKGAGTLLITDGLVVPSSIGFVGDRPGSTGTAMVTGAGSRWTNSGNLYVGDQGTGALTIQSSGYVTSTSTYIGYALGSTGTVTVTGTNSSLYCSGDLCVGYNGDGSLTVANGGTVTARGIWASLGDLHGNGRISAGNAVIDTDLILDSTHGPVKTLAFGSGGTLSLSLGGTASLGVGFKGTGTLRIADGLVVSSSGGFFGFRSGSTGTATVTGAGSKWTNSGSLYVGYSGLGSLSILAGGQVVNSTSGYNYVGYSDGSSGAVTVSGTGSLWSYYNDLVVGYAGSGSLTIESGGQVANSASKSLYLGYTTGAHGRLNVSGTSSKYTNVASYYVGYSGDGDIDIEGGASVSSSYGYIGYNAGSTGAATVNGLGSTWNNTNDLYVGNNGSGSLTVANGGSVVTNTLYASSGDLFGNGTIMARSAIIDADLSFDSTHGVNATFGSGGALTLNPSSTLPMGVGYRKTGTMRIADGQAIASSYGYLGFRSGSTGTATATGLGTKWTTSFLYVGYAGDGTLNVEGGAEVAITYGSSSGYIGCLSGATGLVTVSGTGSKLNNSSNLSVGGTGNGRLIIERGGQATSGLTGIGYERGSSGEAVVTGPDSEWAAYGLSIGVKGCGALTINSGGQVSNTGYYGYVGENSGSTGTVLVDGQDSCWTTRGLWVGRSGNGALTIQDGGRVNNTDDSWGSYVGYGVGAGGAAVVTGLGSIWTNVRELRIGDGGHGTLDIQDGGCVTNTLGYIGYGTASTGTVTVTGTGSAWNNSSDLYIGYSGSGKLAVADGGSVTARTLYGSLVDLLGNGTVTAYGSVLDSEIAFDGAHSPTAAFAFGSGGALVLNPSGSGALGAGFKSAGTLRIADGVKIASTCGYLGYFSGSAGTATISGIGSTWTNSGPVYVGYSGVGSLTIDAGGQMSDTIGYLGYNSGSSGAAIISGTGSKWVNSDDIYVVGTLSIQDGGQVSSVNGIIGGSSASMGKVTVSGTGSTWTNTGFIRLGNSGGGSLTIDAGGQVSSVDADIIFGTAAVSGVGSKWTNSGFMSIGKTGLGSIRIDSGAQVASVGSDVFIGYSN